MPRKQDNKSSQLTSQVSYSSQVSKYTRVRRAMGACRHTCQYSQRGMARHDQPWTLRARRPAMLLMVIGQAAATSSPSPPPSPPPPSPPAPCACSTITLALSGNPQDYHASRPGRNVRAVDGRHQLSRALAASRAGAALPGLRCPGSGSAPTSSAPVPLIAAPSASSEQTRVRRWLWPAPTSWCRA